VLDPLNGYLLLAEKLYEIGPGFTEGWNFAPTNTHTVYQVVDKILSLWGRPVAVRHDKSQQPHEDPYMMLDSTKARLKLGWKPALDLEASLRWIVDWVKNLQNGGDVRDFTERQIKQYMGLAEASGITDRRKPLPAGPGDRDLVELLHDTVIIRNMEGRILYWNQGASDMYGWRSEEAVGNVSHKLLQTKFPKALSEIEAKLAGEGRWEGQLVHTRRDGGKLVVKSRWVLKPNHQNRDGEVLEINQIGATESDDL
jgi:PAS domain S-box-containing protein